MPTVYEVYGFKIYFWSNENNEPVHFHVSKCKMQSNSTKFWILSDGSVELASNSSKYKKFELRRLIGMVYALSIQYSVINLWRERFRYVRFIR